MRKYILLLVSLTMTLLGVAALTATSASATITTVTTSADAFIASDLPTTVENTTQVSTDASPLRYGYFKFAVTVPAGENVTSAIFKCWAGSSNTAGAGVWTAPSSWAETTITWNNATQPNFTLPASGQTGAVTASTYAQADVTSAITGSGTYTLVTKTTSTTQWSCASKENTGNHPAQLVVTSAVPANQPPVAAFTSSCTNLTCSFDGSTSSDPDGTISSYDWNFGDASAHGTGVTTSHAYTAAGTYTVTLTVTDNLGAQNSVSHTVSPTAPVTHTNTALPARGTVIYPWYPEAWTQNGVNPATHYTPTAGFYTSTTEFPRQVADLAYGNFKFALSSWWGQGSKEDTRFGSLLTAAHGSSVKFAPYYEAEGNSIASEAGSPNPTSAQITSDLNYVAANYINDPNYLWVLDKPVIVAYGDGTDNCGMVDRWTTGNAAATTQFYVVLKVFSGYTTCTNQPNNWHQYGPSVAEDQQGTHSFSISPGYWKYSDTTPLLTRDLTRWHTNVTDMNCSNSDLQLVTTYNEWGEGTSVESANEWSSASGHGSYMDELHNNATCTPTDQPPTASFTVTPSSGTVPLAVSVDGSASTDDHGITGYDWNWGDGSAHGSGVTATHTYSTAGTYTVTLTVTDTASQTGTATHTVTASNPVDQPPTASFTVTPTSGTVPLTVNVNGSASTDDHGISSYDWNWGDASTHGTGVTTSHTYATAGTYTITLTVTDTANQTGTATHTVTASNPGTQHKVMVIIGENHSLSEVTAQMPYLTGLGNTYGHATNYKGITHPSLPNYLAFAEGSTFGITDDNPPSSHPIAGDSVFDQSIALGKTAKSYQETMTSNCQQSSSGNYAVKHNPWAYNNGTTQRANCNANDVPMGTTTSGNLLTDINAGNLPATGEMTPNLCNDAHDCNLATFDTWLQGWIPKLTAGPDYTSGNLTIIITFDEDDSTQSNTVAFVVVDPRLSGKVVSATGFNHYSLTRWYDDNVGAALLRNASTAADLRAAFGL